VVVASVVEQDKRLVAYIVWRQSALSLSEMREYLKQYLPEYMIPSHWVTMNELPLTPNGKIERKKLPSPFEIQRELVGEKELIKPRDLLEYKLAQLWSSLLNIESISVSDNFFDLGGHSLLALHLIAKVKQEFKIELPITALFHSPTIASFAKLLHKMDSNKHSSTLVEIKVGRGVPLFCIHPLGGNVLCYAEMAALLGEEQTVYGLQVGEGRRPDITIEQMAAHYIEEIYKVQPHGHYHLLGWSLGGMIAFEMAQQLNGKVALLAIIDSAPFIKIHPQNSNRAKIRSMLLWELASSSGLAIPFESIDAWDDDKKLEYLWQQLQTERRVASEIEFQAFSLLYENTEVNYLAALKYQPQIYPNKIIFFKSSDTNAEMLLVDDSSPGADLAALWSKLSTQPLDIYSVPGNHQSMMSRPNVATIAEKLKELLATTR
jgi:thioesterase domain-containing protein/acyl carrier protein